MKILIATILSLVSSMALAGDSVSSPISGAQTKPQSVQDDTVVMSKTQINFNDTLIEGKMQAPAGFFLQGRKAQDLTQMVKLRSNFRSELRNSKSAVKALVK